MRVGINGYGSIARNFLRCAIESDRGVDVVAINAPGISPELLLYLIKYNSVYSSCPGVIKSKPTFGKPIHSDAPNCLLLDICGREIAYFDYKNPADIPWHWVDVEYVLEASEHLVKLEDAEKHLSGGRARKVVVIGDTVDIPIIFYPISYRKYQRGCSIISAGSADALAFATLLYLLDKELGIIEGIATLMTGFSSNQRIVDGPVSDEWRLGRGAVQSIIPYNLKRVLHTILQSMPDMAGKILITGCSVPVDSGSAVDFTCRLSRPVASARELADILRESNTLKTLEAIHMKCQPGWLLSHWCPEIPELKKSDLPKVECAVNPNTTNHSNVQEISAPLGDEVWFAAKRETKVKEVTTLEPLPQKFVEPASDVVHFWQDEADCCVGRDILSSGCMVTLDVHSSLSITDGSLMKLIAWYDRDMSFCKRILDLLVYMRYVDHS